jgi:hypothetical protein
MVQLSLLLLGPLTHSLFHFHLHLSFRARWLIPLPRFVPFQEIFACRRTGSEVELHYIERRKKYKWRPCVCRLGGDERALGSLFHEVSGILSQFHTRPRKLRIFINPFGGKQRARENMAKVRPLFELAKVRIAVRARLLASVGCSI